MVNISENLEVLEGVKDDIKTAIENKGIVINDTTPFVDYATKINEISIGTGDYQDGYEQGKLDQKALLENRTFRRNGTYSRPDGYGTVVVDVPSGGTGDYETGFEDGVAAQKAKLTNITITNNGTYTREDGYSTVVVDVAGGTTGSLALVDGTKLAYSNFSTIPYYYDFSNITDMYYMFNQCYFLQNIPLIDTSNVTNMFGMFKQCTSLISIPQLDTSNVTNMMQMFYDCRSLQTIPQLDTSNVTDMSGMFVYCTKLTTIPELDTRKVTNMDSMFYHQTGIQTLISLPKIYCDSCNNMEIYFSIALMPNLTDVGGWINLNINWSDDYGLAKCPNLTYQSCINILNGLADMTGTDGRTLKVHQNFLDTVGDEINIGINKNWTISA